MHNSDDDGSVEPNNAAQVDPSFPDVVLFVASDETPFGLAEHVRLRAKHSARFRSDFQSFIRMLIKKCANPQISAPAMRLFHDLCGHEPN